MIDWAYENVRGNPFPLQWWKKHDRFGLRVAGQKLFRTCWEASALSAPNYFASAIEQHLHVTQVVDNELPITTWVSLANAVGKGHAGAMNEIITNPVLPAEYREWLRANTDECRDLLAWFVLWGVCASLFNTALFHKGLPGGPGDSILRVEHPQPWAVGWADGLLVMTHRGDDGLAGSLMCQTLAISNVGCGVPPWSLA